MPIERALARERLFFERHPAYRPFAARCGSGHLATALVSLLFGAVRAWLPVVRSEISLMLQSAEAASRDLGEPVPPGDGAGASALLLRLLSRFASNFNDLIDGRVSSSGGGGDMGAALMAGGDDLLTAQMFGGARIQEVIRSRFYCATAEWLAAFQRNDPAILPDEVCGTPRRASPPRQ